MLYSRSFYTLLSCCALESLFSVNLRLLLWRAACLCLARYLCKGQHAEEKLVAGNMQSSHSVSHATPTLKSSCQAGWLAWHSRPSCLYFHIGIASMEGSSPSTPGKAILEPKRHTASSLSAVEACSVLWSAAPCLPPHAANTSISLSQQPFPLFFMRVSEQRLACVLWLGVQISPLTSTMKRSLLSPVVLFIFSSQDKTHHQLLSGVIKWHLSKVIEMADVHTVNFLRLEIPASVLLNVTGTYVFKS